MSTEVATVQAQNAVGDITTASGFYTSLQVTTRADKMNLLKAINNSVPLQDKATSDNKEIAIVDVVLQEVQIADEKTGQLEDSVRITLIDADGVAWHATSKGIGQSLKQTFGVLGEPNTWEEPLVVSVAEEKGRNGFRYMTLKF